MFLEKKTNKKNKSSTISQGEKLGSNQRSGERFHNDSWPWTVVYVPLSHFLVGAAIAFFLCLGYVGITNLVSFFDKFSNKKCNKRKDPGSPSVPGSNLALKFLGNKLELVAILAWDLSLHGQETVYSSCERKQNLFSRERMWLFKNFNTLLIKRCCLCPPPSVYSHPTLKWKGSPALTMTMIWCDFQRQVRKGHGVLPCSLEARS